MATRLYFMPAVTEVLNGRLTKHPKYSSLMVNATTRQNMDFGAEPFFLTAADLTDSDHLLVAANADVITVPVTLLDTAMTNVWTSAVRPRLESVNVPGHWMTAGQTHRSALTTVVHMFQFLQSLQGAMSASGSFFVGGITLDSTWISLSNDQRQNIQNAAAQLGMDTSWIISQMQIREILKGFADRWNLGPIQLLDVTL